MHDTFECRRDKQNYIQSEVKRPNASSMYQTGQGTHWLLCYTSLMFGISVYGQVQTFCWMSVTFLK